MEPQRRYTVTIDRLGAQGDGAALVDSRTIHVPLTAPGDVVSIEIADGRGRLAEVLTAGPDRVAPRCPHYGECGGCALQHVADPVYLEFKRRLVSDALLSVGLNVAVEPVVPCRPRTRRRAALAAARTASGLVLGFHGRRQHRIVPIRDCAVLDPGIQSRLPELARLAGVLAPQRGAIALTITHTRTGLDVAVTGVDRRLPADLRLRAVELAAELRFARASINGEPILETQPPAVRMGEAWVTPPPGGFLQAVESAEHEMLRLVRGAVGDARRIADLFAGCGTFTLALAGAATLHAVEADSGALTALSLAARRTTGLNPVTTETRDLFRRPLTVEELGRFDAVVIDPPRAGADTQCGQLAKSRIRRIAMVSCNPLTFARDVRVLVEGGYRIGTVTPVDQFLWSPHIEIVAALSR